jgi:thiamine pyrophosphate-dependent acetolactate synthase large subunit-like protein
LEETVEEKSADDSNDSLPIATGEDTRGENTISDVMIETMVNWGVTHVFGMVGHSNLGLSEAIRRQCEAGKLSFIGIRHEGAASFAASAYGKLTGRPAACLAIAGPGATNLLTGLWDAKLDRVPVLALTGQVDLQFLGPGSFQEVNLPAAFDSVAAWSQTVLEESDHVGLMNLALKNAIITRNVSHLIFPNQVQDVHISADVEASGPAGRLTSNKIVPPAESIDNALHAIRKSQKPVIIVGHGARYSMDSIVRFAEHHRVPVITTFKAKGVINDNHPLACGVLGLSGTPVSSHFMSDSDLLIVLGASFSKHTGIVKSKPTIQVDLDPMILGKFHAISNPVWGEIGVTVDILTKEMLNDEPKIDRHEEIAKQWKDWREEKKRREKKMGSKGIHSATVFSAMTKCIPEDAVIAVDVGNNTYSFGRYFECRSQSILMSGYLGSIGYGYPAAIGAWAAAPDRPLVAVTGDGGFAQYMAELSTAVKYNIPIKHILLNNKELGKISKEQRDDGKQVWSTSLHNPDFHKYAEVTGVLGVRVSDPSEIEKGIDRIFEHDGPGMLEVMIDPELI